MAGDLDDPLDDQDEIRQRYQPNSPQIAPPPSPSGLRGIAPPEAAPAEATPGLGSTPKIPPSAPSTPASPSGSLESMDEGAGKIPAMMGQSLRTETNPDKPTPLQMQTDRDTAKQAELSKGSGISQIGNPYARNALRGLNAVGSVLLGRGNMASIPGTTEHHDMLAGQNRGNVSQDITERGKEAQASNLEQTPELKQEALDAKTAASDAERQRKEEHDQGALAEQYRKLGLKIDPTTKQPVPLPYEELSPQEQGVHDLKAAQTDAAEAKSELEKLQADPNSPMYQMQLKRLQVAQQNAQNAAKRLQLSTAQFSNKLNEQDLMKPSGQSQSRGSAAQAALDVLPKLQSLVQKNGSQMGTIMGRLNRGEIAIGDVDPDVAELYGAMKSFYALQPAVHGFRTAAFVKDFESAVGTLERDPKAFIAGMQGLKPTMEAVRDEGKTFHHRIVASDGAQPTQNPVQISQPQRPSQVPPNYVFKDGPKGKGWYKP